MPTEDRAINEELQKRGRVYDRLLLKKDLQSFWLFRDPHGDKGAFGDYKWLCFINTEIPYNYVYCSTPQDIASSAQSLMSTGWHAETNVLDEKYFGRGIGRWPSEAYINAMKDALDRSSKAEEPAMGLFECGD